MKITHNILAAIALFTAFNLPATTPVDLKVEESGHGLLLQKKTHSKNRFNTRSSSAVGLDWDANRMNKSGLFVNFGFFLPSKTYLNPGYGNYGNYSKIYKLGFGVEVGNYFKIVRINPVSIGLRATWLSFGYTSYNNGIPINAFSLSLVRVGPQAAIALKGKMGVDVFYQVGVNYTLQMISLPTKNVNSSFLGLTHEVGAGFRYRIFNVGLGYTLGNLSNISNDPGGTSGLNKLKFPINNFRIFFGFKF